MKIIFLGTPHYAVPFLQALIDNNLAPSVVITQPDQPVGRKQDITPPAVKVTALKNDIEICQPDNINSPEWVEKIKNIAPDLIVTVAFGQIISKSLLDIPRLGCINVHPSLLPRHRGSTPLQSAILHGDTETGVTIMLMDEKMDHGPILSQERIILSPVENTESLREKTTSVGTRLLIDVIEKLASGSITPQEQDHDQATYTSMLTRESGQLDWGNPATQADRQLRAFSPWPGIWTMWQGKRLKILDAHIIESDTTEKPVGTFFVKNNALVAQCNPGLIVIDSLQLEGKKPMSGLDFANGYLK